MFTLRMMLCAAAFSLVILHWPPVEASTTVLASGAAASIKPAAQNKTLGDCPASCGNLSIAYPFGIGPDCSRGPDFRLTCDGATRPPKLFLRDGVTEVIDSITVGSDGNYYGPNNYVMTSIWRAIPMNSGVRLYNLSLEPLGRSFFQSYTALNITGCDLDVYWGDQTAGMTKLACSTRCPDEEMTESAARYNCSGIGCCAIRVALNLHNVTHQLISFYHRRSSGGGTGTGTARSNQTSLLRDRITVASYDYNRLSWSIVDQPNCLQAKKNITDDYACISSHSRCFDDQNGWDIGIGTSVSIVGYFCDCEYGYAGNPYVLDGCATDKGYNPKQSRTNCTRRCGDISVPFPFGLEEGCFAREQFHLVCSNATTSSAVLKLHRLQVIDLNVNQGIINYTQQMDVFGTSTGELNLFVDCDGSVVSSVQWVAANLSCIEAKQNISGYACVSINSTCVAVSTRYMYVGYRCKCPEGFDGNPYIHNGCRDIDECLQQDICKGRVCSNIEGSFKCTECPGKTVYDPTNNQCTRTRQPVLLIGDHVMSI